MQIAVFPMDIVNITQGEGGSYSHVGKLAIDFIGTSTKYPYYAPFDCTCTLYQANNALLQWVSDELVLCADGQARRIIFWAIHECNPVRGQGSKVKQGQLLGHTGICGNVTGDHVHFEVWEYSNGTRGTALHLYDVFALQESTTIINDYGYNWRFTDNIGPWPTPGYPSLDEYYLFMRKQFIRRRR